MTATAHGTDPAAAALHALAGALGGRASPCQTSDDPELWFNTDTAPDAIALCAQCHAADECLNYGTAIDARHGIWGGRSLTVDRHGTRTRTGTAPRPRERERGDTA